MMKFALILALVLAGLLAACGEAPAPVCDEAAVAELAAELEPLAVAAHTAATEESRAEALAELNAWRFAAFACDPAELVESRIDTALLAAAVDVALAAEAREDAPDET